MNQILKPDRPIWPPVPETIVPPDTGPGEAKPTEREAAPADRLPMDATAGKPGGFEGFGSFSA